jgi:hypothetical protein
MNYVLSVFVDALKPESLEWMPFLRSFGEKRRIETELGYSTTCHASMYTGVYPNKHLVWFIWQYSPHTSPFKWIKNLKLHLLPQNTYSRYLCHRISCYPKKDITAFFRIPFLWNLPLRDWHHFDVAEKRFWTEPGYLEEYPTVFEILRGNRIGFDVVGMPANHEESLRILRDRNRVIKGYAPDEVMPWTYLFVGDIDPLSHFFGQDSTEVKLALKQLDDALEQKYEFFRQRVGDFTFLLFSDHGHVRVEDAVNPYHLFESSGKRLEDYIFFVDSNYARFWFRNEKEQREILDVLSNLSDKGFVITEELSRKYRVDMPDNRYGDLVFYLDAPHIFDRGEVYVMGKRRNPSYVSMHGYLPDNRESDGILVSNRPLVGRTHIKLVDIMPSILEQLDAPIPENTDGTVIWQ